MQDKSFKEKLKEKKYQAKVKLSLYGIFILFVCVLAFLGNNSSKENLSNNINDNTNEEQAEVVSFNLPDDNKYIYTIEINSNDNTIIYTIEVNDNEKIITKLINEEETKYKEINNNYYKLENKEYVLTTKKEIYDNNYDYINIDNINNYLKKAIKLGEKYIVYVKDIILDSNSDDYISIKINSNKIRINYTNLLKEFGEKSNKYIVEINILQ